MGTWVRFAEGEVELDWESFKARIEDETILSETLVRDDVLTDAAWRPASSLNIFRRLSPNPPPMVEPDPNDPKFKAALAFLQQQREAEARFEAAQAEEEELVDRFVGWKETPALAAFYMTLGTELVPGYDVVGVRFESERQARVGVYTIGPRDLWTWRSLGAPDPPPALPLEREEADLPPPRAAGFWAYMEGLAPLEFVESQDCVSATGYWAGKVLVPELDTPHCFCWVERRYEDRAERYFSALIRIAHMTLTGHGRARLEELELGPGD